jgi:hypothetical protein
MKKAILPSYMLLVKPTNRFYKHQFYFLNNNWAITKYHSFTKKTKG